MNRRSPKLLPLMMAAVEVLAAINGNAWTLRAIKAGMTQAVAVAGSSRRTQEKDRSREQDEEGLARGHWQSVQTQGGYGRPGRAQGSGADEAPLVCLTEALALPANKDPEA